MTLHEDLAAAWQSRGLNVLEVRPASGFDHRPNPTIVRIGTGGNKSRSYQVFAWRTTHEGKGRVGNDLRIQATSFGASNTPYTVNQSVVGVGYSEPYGVFFGFDPWVKRHPGTSSSVHVKRALIEAGEQTGLAAGGHNWDRRLAFTVAHAEELLPWVGRLWERKQISVKCLAIDEIDIDHRIVRVDPISSRSGNGVRPGDRLALFKAKGKNPDGYLWRVRDIGIIPVETPSGRNRYHLTFTVVRSAKASGKLEKP